MKILSAFAHQSFGMESLLLLPGAAKGLHPPMAAQSVGF